MNKETGKILFNLNSQCVVAMLNLFLIRFVSLSLESEKELF